jgi:hypothetical protein
MRSETRIGLILLGVPQNNGPCILCSAVDLPAGEVCGTYPVVVFGLVAIDRAIQSLLYWALVEKASEAFRRRSTSHYLGFFLFVCYSRICHGQRCITYTQIRKIIKALNQPLFMSLPFVCVSVTQAARHVQVAGKTCLHSIVLCL